MRRGARAGTGRACAADPPLPPARPQLGPARHGPGSVPGGLRPGLALPGFRLRPGEKKASAGVEGAAPASPWPLSVPAALPRTRVSRGAGPAGSACSPASPRRPAGAAAVGAVPVPVLPAGPRTCCQRGERSLPGRSCGRSRSLAKRVRPGTRASAPVSEPGQRNPERLPSPSPSSDKF